jgi:hypothetical protein
MERPCLFLPLPLQPESCADTIVVDASWQEGGVNPNPFSSSQHPRMRVLGAVADRNTCCRCRSEDERMGSYEHAGDDVVPAILGSFTR